MIMIATIQFSSVHFNSIYFNGRLVAYEENMQYTVIKTVKRKRLKYM